MEGDIEAIYKQFYHKCQFKEVDHVPREVVNEMWRIEEECLVINFDAFEKYYETLIKKVIDEEESMESRLHAADILITMNGQNEKAWNLKRVAVAQGLVDLKRQLRLNAAILMKFKKSSIGYDFRLRLIASSIQDKCDLTLLHKSENELMKNILDRFYRNYFCWTYRLKLTTLLLKQQTNLLASQLDMVHKFIDNHPNDYSAFSYLRSLNRNYPVCRYAEQIWSKKLLQFCQIAYQNKQEYKHLVQYDEYVQQKH